MTFQYISSEPSGHNPHNQRLYLLKFNNFQNFYPIDDQFFFKFLCHENIKANLLRKIMTIFKKIRIL